MEGLRSDLRGVQAALKDLLERMECRLQVPSWRFPEKLSSSLNIDELLRKQGDDCHVFLLELIIDRLLFMFQCCLHISEQSGRQNSSKPLTLASATKKFSKRFTQDIHSVQRLKSKLAANDGKLAEKESALTKLQDQCKSLQAVLDSSVAPRTSLQQQDSEQFRSTVAFGSLLSSSSSCIPYEAEGTLKVNRLALTSRSLSSVQSSITETKPHCQPPSALKTSGESPSPLPCVRGQVSVCVQTTATAFALCVHCTATQHTLADVATTLSAACSQHSSRDSKMAAVDWKSSAQVGGLQLEKWSAAFHSDLRSLDTCCSEFESRCEQLTSERSQQKQVIADLEADVQALIVQAHTLQASTEDMQRSNERLLSSNKETYETQIRKLEHTQSKLQVRIKELKEELQSANAQETHLRTTVASLEHRCGQLEQQVQRAQAQELQLLLTREAMESELHCVQGQLGQYHQQLEEGRAELSKSQELHAVLEKELKTLQAQHASVYADRENQSRMCDKLYLEVLTYKERSQHLERTYQSLQEECGSLKELLGAARHELADSSVQHAELCGAISQLEKKLTQVEVGLKQEEHRCRLLMDYPFVKQTSADYATHIASLSNKESQKQVSANTVRILLLEEQNSELRERLIAMARERRHSQPHGRRQLQHPTPIWQNELLLQVSKEQKAAREMASEAPPTSSHPNKSTRKSRSATAMNAKPDSSTSAEQVAVGGSSGSLRSSSSTKLKGRLGHIVTAIADAQQSSSAVGRPREPSSSESPASLSPRVRSPVWRESADCLEASASYSNIEVHMCSKCDRMYHTVEDLELHHMICMC